VSPTVSMAVSPSEGFRGLRRQTHAPTSLIDPMKYFIDYNRNNR
jgi:hypothetical protein